MSDLASRPVDGCCFLFKEDFSLESVRTQMKKVSDWLTDHYDELSSFGGDYFEVDADGVRVFQYLATGSIGFFTPDPSDDYPDRGVWAVMFTATHNVIFSVLFGDGRIDSVEDFKALLENLVLYGDTTKHAKLQTSFLYGVHASDIIDYLLGSINLSVVHPYDFGFQLGIDVSNDLLRGIFDRGSYSHVGVVSSEWEVWVMRTLCRALDGVSLIQTPGSPLAYTIQSEWPCHTLFVGVVDLIREYTMKFVNALRCGLPANVRRLIFPDAFQMFFKDTLAYILDGLIVGLMEGVSVCSLRICRVSSDDFLKESVENDRFDLIFDGWPSSVFSSIEFVEEDVSGTMFGSLDVCDFFGIPTDVMNVLDDLAVTGDLSKVFTLPLRGSKKKLS